ncbi:MAG TPA: hypothetical protein VIY71_01505 [Solirubrobacterales bacterium]
MAALALTLLGASSAQAASSWMVAGANLTSGEKSVKATVVGTGVSLLTKIEKAGVKFSCKKAELIGIALKPEGKLTEGGTARFTECKTFINEKESPVCEPNNGGAEKGVIATNKLKGELTFYKNEEGVTLVKSTVEEEIEKVKQPVFARIKMSAECSIGTSVPIFGSAIGLVDSGGLPGLLNETGTHKFKEGPLTELWAVSKTEEHKVTIDGELEASLTSSEVWNGLAFTAQIGLKNTPMEWHFLTVGAEKSFMIKNETGNPINDLVVKVLPNENDYQRTGTNCGAMLANGATCEVTIKCINRAIGVLESNSVAQNALGFSVLLP